MSDQLDLLSAYSPPDPTAHYWRGFTRDTDEAEASRLFTARYGAPPEFIIEAKGILLAGPIPARTDAYTTMPDVKPQNGAQEIIA